MSRKSSYTREFKLEVAKCISSGRYTSKEAAGKFGVNPWTVRDWVRKFRKEGILPPLNETSKDADEVRKLKKELSDLKMENEILKKAAAYFAKDSL